MFIDDGASVCKNEGDNVYEYSKIMCWRRAKKCQFRRNSVCQQNTQGIRNDALFLLN